MNACVQQGATLETAGRSGGCPSGGGETQLFGTRARSSCALAAAFAAGALAAVPAGAAGPEPGTPAYLKRDLQNMRDAYGRQTAPDGQLDPDYIAELPSKGTPGGLAQVAEQAANPTRPILDPGQWFPGWNAGNAYRQTWPGVRGQVTRVAFTNRYGALLHGDVYAPLPGAKDPYTGETLQGPFPGVVVTTGSLQGSEHMYQWVAEDLAERGYVVLTYDVQGQGTSETFPHQHANQNIPFCRPNAPKQDGEETGCPGFPFQQDANFVYGTLDAMDFFQSTPTTRTGRWSTARPTPRRSRPGARTSSRSSATRSAPRPSPTCKASTRASRPWSPSTSSTAHRASGVATLSRSCPPSGSSPSTASTSRPTS
jgi:hypothetical protein